MNAHDFEQIRDLLSGTRAVLDGIRACCRFEPGTTPADVTQAITQLEVELGTLIEALQNGRRMAWESRNPDHRVHHVPPIRWPDPTRVPDGQAVLHLDVHGHAPSRTQPAPSGIWGHEQRRRRRHA